MHLPVTFYQWGWIIWALYFGVLETLALIDKGQGDTLSENIRLFRTLHPALIGFLVGTLLTWLFYHFLFEHRVGNT